MEYATCRFCDQSIERIDEDLAWVHGNGRTRCAIPSPVATPVLTSEGSRD